jgi:hypothetical protein
MRLQIPAVFILVNALIGTTVPLGAQSLGDIAQKEEERRKAVKAGGGKVYTNKDLGNAPPPSPVSTPAAGASSGAAAGQRNADAAKDQGDVKDQKYWAGRMSALREAVDRDQTYVDALQSRINGLSAEFINRDDPSQRARIEGDRQKALNELNRLKKVVVDEKKAISDLEDEARRAGAPPGWLR